MFLRPRNLAARVVAAVRYRGSCGTSYPGRPATSVSIPGIIQLGGSALMKRPRSLLFTLLCLSAAPLVAQTQIGGNTCSSSTLTGPYSFSMTGRQVTSAGNFTNVFQGNGSASFDGENSVTITQTTDTILAVGAPATWTGSYSVQANCTGVITITSGASVTLNLAIYDQGVDFLVSGNDAIYAYSGSGNTAPANCSAATLSGVYTFTATGYSLASG